MEIYNFMKREITEAIKDAECFKDFDDLEDYLTDYIGDSQYCIYEGQAIDIFSRSFSFFLWSYNEPNSNR